MTSPLDIITVNMQVRDTISSSIRITTISIISIIKVDIIKVIPLKANSLLLRVTKPKRRMYPKKELSLKRLQLISSNLVQQGNITTMTIPNTMLTKVTTSITMPNSSRVRPQLTQHTTSTIMVPMLRISRSLSRLSLEMVQFLQMVVS